MTTETPVRTRRIKKPGTIPLRQLWQVPTFVLGLMSLLAVASTRPLWSSGADQRLDRYLATARKALDAEAPDAERVATLAERALRLAPPVSPTAAEAHFLIGSADILRAQQAPAEQAKDHWLSAHYHLQQAEAIGMPPRDQLRHGYRLGKVCYFLGYPPQQVIDYLMPSVAADNAFEAYGLLAQSYLRLEPPEPALALAATQKQLALPTTDETALAKPRLRCGELLRQLDQPGEARKVLQRIGIGSAPDVLFQARLLLARLHQDEGAWQEAAAVWELLNDDPRVADHEPARIWYDLGLCYRHLDKVAQAMEAWEKAMTFAGAESQAAALGLAELRLLGDQPARAIEAFEKALSRVNRSEDYANPIIDLTEARRRVAAGCQALLQGGHYSAALQLAEVYERIAAAGQAQNWVGQASEAWAKATQKAATQAETAERTRLQEEAKRLFAQAGRAFQTVADTAAEPEVRAHALWQSAISFQSALEHAQTILVLEKFVQMPVLPARRGQAWFVIGETQRLSNNDFAALAAFRKSIEFAGPHAFRARYQLALAELEKNRVDEAETMLAQNLEMFGAATDDDAREQTLYTLAGIHFQKKDWRMATIRYQEALERYPSNPTALKGRLHLALACRQQADQASQRLVGDLVTPAEREHYRKIRMDFLDKAAAAFQQLDVHLAARSHLTAEEKAMAKQAAFAVGECRFDLGQYDEALKAYEVLANRYQNQVEGLIALRSVWQCHGVKLEPDKARVTLERVRTALREMPTNAFDDSSDIRSKRWWENWVQERIKLADTRS